ncbi:hypothetical protein [Vannielia litorea]|uniref:Membrane-associated oxidoreductase n=1 Tax=Vannielia litorea TaxID=1217970 RepID=A0A1N6IHZ3_9RHOB|nr:hypothetical protein [Vannielia litorea]SIO31636.1 hypothetical protein SAMN05444002_3919 [Vannielia litorea]
MTALNAFSPLTVAEEKLLAACAGPDRVTLGDGMLPPADAGEAVSLRAALLRELLLGLPDHPVNPKGLRLRGARISGALDLQGTDCPLDITLSACRIDGEMNLVNAALRGLHLSGCTLRAITADNARFSGSVYLRGESRVEGEIGLSGARIGGDLQLCGVTIDGGGQDAVFAPSLRVEGSVFLGNYPYAEGETTLACRGALFFSSARIDHDCFVTHCAIELPAEPLGHAAFGATEEHGADIAVSLARARIGGILYFQHNAITRVVNLAGAEVARFKDEPTGPGAAYPLRLDGFRYSDFSRHADTRPTERLAWLARRPEGLSFNAQPYEQLAYVLGRMGHRGDAQTVLMVKERLLRAENRRLRAETSGLGARWLMMWLSDVVLRFTVGYGYRPGRSVALAVVLIAGLAAFYQVTWNAGDMTPNAAPILTSAPWIEATRTHPEAPGAFWSQPGQAGQDWETFSSLAYAADLVIPLVNFGQEEAWAPSTSRSPWGRVGWGLRWFAKGLGWIVTALAAAALTGVIRRD